MTYTYRDDKFAQQLADAKAAADQRRIILEEKKRQLGELRVAARMVQEMAVEAARVQEEIHELVTGIKRLPPPIHGGRAGLLAATQEIRDHQRTKKATA